MGLQVSSDAQGVFFNKIFGASSPTANRVKALSEAGIVFEVLLFSIRAFADGKVIDSVTLTYGTTSLMKGVANPLVQNQNKHLIEQWVAKVFATVQPSPVAKKLEPVKNSEPVANNNPLFTVVLIGSTVGKVLHLIKAVYQITGTSLAAAKALVDKVPAEIATFTTLPAAAAAKLKLEQAGGLVDVIVDGKPLSTQWKPVEKPKPVNAVILLKDAEALGQQVKGTSTGSVYHTIALTQHIKVAARIIPGGMVSIRTEWTDTPKADLEKLAAAGMQMKSDYGSTHFDPQDVPVERVIGAFLMGTGIHWKEMITSGADLVIGGK